MFEFLGASPIHRSLVLLRLVHHGDSLEAGSPVFFLVAKNPNRK